MPYPWRRLRLLGLPSFGRLMADIAGKISSCVWYGLLVPLGALSRFLWDSAKSTLEGSTSHAERLPARQPIWQAEPLNLGSSQTGGLDSLIGWTPMIRLNRLSAETGCNILAKLEYTNPGGSSKDRVAKQLIRELADSGRLYAGLELVEGSTGSTGISLALVAALYGLSATIFMPSDQSSEKLAAMRVFGAQVRVVPPASWASPLHYSRQAAAYAAEQPGQRIHVDQFENEVGFRAHYQSTGPEVWTQTNQGQLDALVLGAGTAGTLAGVASYLLERRRASNRKLHIFLADPPGSGLYTHAMHGVLYAPQEAEGTRKRHQVDSLVQGVGLNRLTHLVSLVPKVDHAFRIEDQETLTMGRYLVQQEGLFVGSSSALNVVGAVKAARRLGPGHTIVTLLLDAGHRHWSGFWKDEATDSRRTGSYRDLSFVK